MFGLVNDLIHNSLFLLGTIHPLGGAKEVCNLASHLELDSVEPLANGAVGLAQLMGIGSFLSGVIDLLIWGAVGMTVAVCLERLGKGTKGKWVKMILALSMVAFGFSYAMLLPFALAGLGVFCVYRMATRISSAILSSILNHAVQGES